MRLRRNGYIERGTSTCASRKSPPSVRPLVGWLVGASSIQSSRYQQVRERLDHLEASLPMEDGAARSSREKEEEGAELTNTTQEDMDDQLNPLAEGTTDGGRVSTATGNAGIVAAPVGASGAV